MKIFKKLMPVAISLIVIIVIAIVMVVVSATTNKTSTLSNGDENYFQYGKLTVTKQDLYNALKKDYSVAELTRLVDTYLYQDEINKVTDDEVIKYVEKDIFGEDEENKLTAEEKQEKWDEVIESLVLTGIVSKKDADANNAYDAYTSTVWANVKDYYRLQCAKEAWAKKAYLEYYKEQNKIANGEALFDDEAIEDYFEDNYGQVTTGLFIPLTSAANAKALMESVGINYDASASTDSTNQLAGWLKADFNEKENEYPKASDYMTASEVVEAFVKMYNKVLAYTNGGEDIITADLYEKSYSEKLTLQQVRFVLDEAMAEYESIKGNLQLPTVGIINDTEETVSIKWTVIEGENYSLTEDGALTVVRGSNKISKKITATLTLGEETQTAEYSVNVASTTSSDKEQAEPITVEIGAVNKDYEYSFNLNNDLANGHAQFIWEANDDSSFAQYLSANGKKLTIKDTAADFVDSYTVKPVSVGNYSFLFIKLSQTEEVELTDEIKAEIIEKMTEELYSVNNLELMLYKNRNDHKLTIYDNFIEAIYEYNYNYFHGTTLSLKEYDEFKLTKKSNKGVVAKVDDFEITTDQLFEVLEAKYGATYVKNYIDNYLIINSDFNTFYNPYKDIEDKDYVKSLLKSDISSFKQNFELDYFTYSYLSYYGFIPNFPASYGWKNFINDYFNASSEKELLISKNYGGAIYSEVLEAYQESLYNFEAIKAVMEENLKDAYGVDVMNLVISVDYNYDSTSDTKIVKSNEETEKEENWTAEQIALAEELAALIMTSYDNVLATGSIADKLTEMVTVYNNAAYEYAADFVPTTHVEELQVQLAKFKLAGLSLKFEKTTKYDQTSSLVDEFKEAMVEIWNYANEKGLVYDDKAAKDDKHYANPIVEGIKYNVVNADNNYAFATSYGFHAVVVEKAYQPTELPTEVEVELYKAANEYKTLSEELKTANTNLESASGNETAVNSYKTQIKRLEKEVEDAKAELFAALDKIEKVEGYEEIRKGWDEETEVFTIDTKLSAKCTAWYDAALTEVTTYIVEKDILAIVKAELNNMTFASGFDKDQFDYYLNYIEENYNEQE